MPWKDRANNPRAIAYQKAYDATPEQKKKRAMNNAARAAMEDKVGEAALRGKDVDHKRSLDRGGTNASGNLRVMSRAANRGYARDSKGNPKR